MSERPIFYIIDGHAVAYRQFFGLQMKNSRGFTTRRGEITNAVFGFTRVLLDILEKDQPHYLAVSFDGGLSGRDELFSDYKGTREKMPDELVPQLDRLFELTAAFNIPILMLDGYEADDVIGTVVQQAEAEGVNTNIITGDRDLLQLLTPHITVQLPQRGESDVVYDEALFREKFDLEPSQLVDLKGLMCDSSDNIPGIKGVGQKTATTLLQQYQNIEGIYAHIDDLKGSLQKKLIDGEQMAYLSRELATIRRDVPIEINLPDCVAHDFDHERVIKLFRELEFRQFTERLGGVYIEPELEVETLQIVGADEDEDEFAAPAEPEGPDVDTVIVQDEAALQAMVKQLNQAEGITFDVETTSTDQMSADLVGIALAVDGQTGYYVPVGHRKERDIFDMESAVNQLSLSTVLDALREPLTNPNIPKFAHNANYDLVVMQRYGIDVQPIGFDSMIAEWLLEPGSKFLGLKNFANFRLKPPVVMTEITELIGTGKKQITMDLVDIDRAAPYAAADAAVTFRCVTFLQDELSSQPELVKLMDTLELPLIPVLAAME
ncbi:MAG: DNA polymerase I, partial [Anaerolineae bacterium]|nr:DNA polymerase I [Anaerolineae bacterium]